MQKTTLSLLLVCSFIQAEQGSVEQLMQKKKESLSGPSKTVSATAAATIATASLGAALLKQQVTPLPTRSLPLDLVASPLINSSLLWAGMGALGAAFAVYYFIGEEMGIIVQTKGTLKALEKQIELWQIELPKLKENQEHIAKKVTDAVAVLDIITPLVTKLAKNSETTGLSPQVAAIQKELAGLKALVQSLPTAKGQTTGKAIEKQSQSLFGFGKKHEKNTNAQLVALRASKLSLNK